jgi:hypothetical protein
MTATPLPESFAALAERFTGEPSIEQARLLGLALNDVPALQRWLRENRQRTYRALLDAGHSRAELSSRLEVTVQRVSDIAIGHKPGRPKKPEATG